MVLSGCLAPSVPVDEAKLDKCKQQDANSCIDIAKELQTRYDANEGDQHIAKAAYMYLRKACEIDSTKCPLDPKNFFAKNDEKLANIVWLALKDESPRTIAKTDSKYDLAQTCLIRGEIRDYMSQCYNTMYSALDYVDLSQKYKCSSNNTKSCLLDAIHSNPYPRSYLKLHYGLELDTQDIKTIVSYHNERLRQDKDYEPYVNEYNIVHEKLQKAVASSLTSEYFKPNNDNTCIRLQNPNNFLYLQLTKKDKELDELNQNIITQYNENMQKIFKKPTSNESVLSYIDCAKEILYSIDKLADSKDSIVYETIMAQRTVSLLFNCIKDKNECEKILQDEILTDDDKKFFKRDFYNAMNGKKIDYYYLSTSNSKPKSINEKTIIKITYNLYPHSTLLLSSYFGALRRGEDTYMDYAFNSIVENGWELDFDLLNYEIMKVLQEGVDELKAKIRKIISKNSQDFSGIYAKLKQEHHDKFINEFGKIFKGFSLENNIDEFVKIMQSSAADDFISYCFLSYIKDNMFSSKAEYPDAVIIRRKINQKLNTLKTKPLAQMNAIITQKRLEKERLQKQKEMEEARLQKQKEMQRIKEEREVARKERERKEAFERCKRTPQCMAQLRAKAQNFRQQSKKYYMMATNARTKQEYDKYKQLADVACGRAMGIEQTGSDPGLFGLVLGGVENCL